MCRVCIGLSYKQGSPQKKKSSGRSHKNLNLAREQRNNMFTVARARAKKSKDFFIKTQQSIVVSRPITHSPTQKGIVGRNVPAYLLPVWL